MFNGSKLKTDYIINIMHEFILRYDTEEVADQNISSVIMRNKYGKLYNVYLEYLLSVKFLYMVSNYYVKKKTRTYKLNVDKIHSRMRVDITDKILLKKHSREWLTKTLADMFESPIQDVTKNDLIDDLYSININYKRACQWLEQQYASGEMDLQKYTKNLHSVNCINSGHLFYKFDSFGRLHTNFTVIKKYIRLNFLDIDGKELVELDIKNSQPFFLGVLINRENPSIKNVDDVKYFFETVNNGLLYDLFLDKYPDVFVDRNQTKVMIYRVLFGRNNKTIENDIFCETFPTVYKFIKEYKSANGNYKTLSHELQRLESEFVFGKVVRMVKDKFPAVKLFTVHDSIIYPLEYKEEVNIIFRNVFREYLE